jgi:hypothetical protein
MADSTIPASLNGMPMDDDEFERNLKEIMDDGPTLSDSSNTVQSGSPQKAGQANSQSAGRHSPAMPMAKSMNIPPGICFYNQTFLLHIVFKE